MDRSALFPYAHAMHASQKNTGGIKHYKNKTKGTGLI